MVCFFVYILLQFTLQTIMRAALFSASTQGPIRGGARVQLELAAVHHHVGGARPKVAPATAVPLLPVEAHLVVAIQHHARRLVTQPH